ncbi:helix-turn-helix domain-containing protein [Streptomyces triculaminicus]|uniref:Helix-turn-helix domain-containing protein n=2 Tax=Streptomyces TaxID=1883 RepID=A0A939JS71_9ACTN|nr:MULTISPECIES: helix-turn-helix domain-containing protein [Streptomyces]MBO0654359.1 helix-turn-helix domain-containing protein [Streptomyces triculaminicus]QSY48993.1 helix-turn-helix domain-containing protein [Streptomyces griseocarneus]
MHSIVIDTVEFPVNERPEAWAETMALAQVTQRVKFLETATFGARIEMMPLGVGQVSELSYASVIAQRTPRLIRQSDPEMYHVAVVTAGEIGIEQYRQSCLLKRGDMGFFDSSRSFDTFAGDTPGKTLLFQFPKKLLRLPHERFTRLCGLSLPWTEGVGRLFGQYLVGMAEEYVHCTPQDVTRLGGTALDLLSAVLAHHFERDAALPDMSAAPGEAGRNVMFLRISAFIVEHLRDPALGPEAIASAHRISLRYLHRIFQENGTTPRAFIRQQRLDRCRGDLANPALAHLTIHTIAARWGYPQPDGFSRAFRTATGMSPSEYRAAMRGAASPDAARPGDDAPDPGAHPATG